LVTARRIGRIAPVFVDRELASSSLFKGASGDLMSVALLGHRSRGKPTEERKNDSEQGR